MKYTIKGSLTLGEIRTYKNITLVLAITLLRARMRDKRAELDELCVEDDDCVERYPDTCQKSKYRYYESCESCERRPHDCRSRILLVVLGFHTKFAKALSKDC